MTTLADIRLKVRRITKSPSTNQLTNAEIDNYVNTFYLYDFPEHLRLINLKETFTFITQEDIDIYNFTPNTIVSIEPPVYVGGNEIQFFQSREEYFTIYPEIQRNENWATGDGTPGPYAGNITATPVKRNRVLISTVDINGNALSAQDTVAGTFSGDVAVGSTINYITGAIANVTWNANVAVGAPIRVQSVNYQKARPQAALFYDDTIQLSPVPDQAYEFVINAYVTPTALLNANDEPELREWWQLLALGAARKIFGDRLDMESYTKTNILFDEQKRLVERRTLKQISINRASTIYTDDFNLIGPFRSGS
jgi:hypothetical protein